MIGGRRDRGAYHLFSARPRLVPHRIGAVGAICPRSLRRLWVNGGGPGPEQDRQPYITPASRRSAGSLIFPQCQLQTHALQQTQVRGIETRVTSRLTGWAEAVACLRLPQNDSGIESAHP